MTNKTAAEWMKEKIAKYEDSFDFKHEELVLDITEQICNAMEEQGIDRAELADKMGVSRAFISKLLNGTPNLTTKTLLKITLALGRELSVKLPPTGFTTAHLFIPIEGRPVKYKPANPEKSDMWKYAANEIYYTDEGLKNVG